jgi:DeoR family transcriptional regulator of aga operon
VGRIALAQMATIGQVAMLITDSSADGPELDRLRRAGVEVVLADES